MELKISNILFVLLLFIPTQCATDSDSKCSYIRDSEKFDCYPEKWANAENCQKRSCCWAPRDTNSQPVDVPWCYYPKNYGGYIHSNLNITERGMTGFFNRTFPSPYPKDVKRLRVDVEYQTDYRVRVKIYDAENKRYEPMYPKISEPTSDMGLFNMTYKVDISPMQFGFKISRRSGEVLFDTQATEGFIFSDQFLQISSILTGKIYGLGEHRTTFWLDTNWTRYTLFAHDSPPREQINLYGSHPFYLTLEPNGRSHGVFLQNSNAIDVILQPLPAITYRAIGGVLDFYFFMGPTPADVIRQYTETIGRPFLPPYYSLGFQLCKYGYGSAENMRTVWQRTRDAKIPFDVQWADIDYMDNQNDFTIDPVNFKTLPQLVKDIHDAGMFFIPILDPGVSASEANGTYPPYEDGLRDDIFIKNQNGSVFIGKVWNPKTTAFPDFTNPKTFNYWNKQIRDLYQKIPFDGLWIDMNEPSNFLDGGFDGCPDNELENPPYVPAVDGGKLYYKTICMSTKQYAGNHYDVHNLYGISESELTLRSLAEVTGKRGFLLSRSTSPGSGKYTAHWTGDNFSTWHDLTKSIPALLSFSLYGIPFTGADICGFIGNTTKNLCNRWMQLGAFYPFSRNHNSLGNSDQDPVVFGEDVIRSSKSALEIRYSLLPYLYTLFYKAHVYGDTVIRPLFFEFPEDERTYEIDRAFLWGSGLYIIPITDDNSEQVRGFLPAGRWYDWYTSSERVSKGEDVILFASYESIPLLIRGGTIFPIQKPGQTTKESRKNGFTFLVAPDERGEAKGDLFWDDGISLDTIKKNRYGFLKLFFSGSRFTSKNEVWNAPDTPNLEAIKILGIKNVTTVTLNKKEIDFHKDSVSLTVSNINLPLNTEIELTWA